MEKSEKLTLQAFYVTKPPADFDRLQMGMFVADMHGFAQRLLSKGYLKLRENEQEISFDLSKELKQDINKFVVNSRENLLYYNLVKSCLILFEKYRK